MKLADIIDRVFRLTNQTFQGRFHMRDLINSALVTMSNEARLEGKQTISVTPSVAEYPLPTAYKSPRALMEGTFDNPVQIYDLITIDEVRTGYSIWNGNIVLKPTPNADKSLTFYFYKYATELVDDTDTTEPAFEGYGDVIASYAAAMILSLPGADVNQNLVERYFSIWEQGKLRFKTDRAKQNKQTSVRLVNTW